MSEPEVPQPPESIEEPRDLTTDEELPTFYIESVVSYLTPYGMQLTLGEFRQGPPGLMSRKHRVRLFLSPHSAKALATLLAENVQRYESTMGQLPSAEKILGRK